MNNSGEQLMSDVISVIYEMFPYLQAEVTKSKLSQIIAKYKIELDESHEEKTDLHDRIKLFLSTKKLEGFSDSSHKNYKLELTNFANKVNKIATNITSADIRVYLSENDKLKMSTIGTKLIILRSFFKWLHSEDFILRDPTAKLKSPKVEKRMPKTLTIEELEMLREGCQTIKQRAFVEVLYATGARLSEFQALNKSDINYQTMSCTVFGKGSKEREVYFSHKAMYHLKKYLMTRLDNEPALIVTERKPYRRLGKRSIQREIEKIAKQAGLDKTVSPHDLRRTFATLTLNNGADITAVQELLGHTSPETTLRYARITEERKREQHKKYLVQ